MKIKCQRCGREMEKRGNRVLCIKCTNQRNKEVAKIYRDGYREKKEAGL